MSSFSRGLSELEGILERNPRGIDDYAANPFGVLVYDPTEEFLLRTAIFSLQARLNSTRKVEVVSLAELLGRALAEQLAKERLTREELFAIEVEQGFGDTASQITALLDREASLVTLIAAAAEGLDDRRDVLFLVRAGILYPFYRVSPFWKASRGTPVYLQSSATQGGARGRPGFTFSTTKTPSGATGSVFSRKDSSWQTQQ